MISITNCVSLWFRPCYKMMLNYENNSNAENLWQYKSRFSLIDLALASSTDLAR